MIEKYDIKALIRVIALAMTGDPAEVEEVIKWAYQDKKQTRTMRPKEIKEKEKAIAEAANRIYAIYPSSVTRPDGIKAHLKSPKDKDKIIRILGSCSEETLTATIRRYLSEVDSRYTKMLSTFLNNLPDFEEATPIQTQDNSSASILPGMAEYLESRKSLREK